MTRICCLILAGLVAVAVILPGSAGQAQQGYYYFQRYEPEPSAAWMMYDTLFERPIGIAGTVAGIGMFAGTLPLTLATGTSGDAARAFIERPARWTFQRRLGRSEYDRAFWLP
jgi:hypothetical protein|uniref:Uncharacterized protein n=1 Tax=Desulfobacca acetoxidans TaxID=60893 RepID=A0A7C5ENP0_9BACT